MNIGKKTINHKKATRDFWNSNPCGSELGYSYKRKQRYDAEPWLPNKLKEIAKHPSILEVGCGQGVDMVEIFNFNNKVKYVACDHSEKSLNIARKMTKLFNFNAEFKHIDAELLSLPSQFSAAYSMGVLHHTDDENLALRNIYLSLKPSGTAYIVLYRTWSIKVLIAKFFRLIQSFFSILFFTDKVFYKLLKNVKPNTFLGTMVHECFGVPILKSYTKQQILAMFKLFDSVKIETYGNNFGKFSLTNKNQENKYGFLFFITAKKLDS